MALFALSAPIGHEGVWGSDQVDLSGKRFVEGVGDFFRMRRGDEEFNPFEAINQLMAGKLTRENWLSRCRELGISDLVLLPDVTASGHPAEPLVPRT